MTVDYSSSYVVMGNTVISGPSYIYVKYSYEFIPQAGSFPYSSTQGYSNGSLLNLVKAVTSSNSTSYYKMFNPVNLAFINIDGSCRTSSSNDSDQINLISLKFGVNSLYTCYGASPIASTNLK